MITKYIGQTEIVGELNEMLLAHANSAKKNEVYKWRPIFLGGYTGTGKSNLARALAEQLVNFGFNYHEVPPNAGMKELYQMANKIASFDPDTQQVSAIPYVILWDEFHAQKQGLDLIKALTTQVTEAHTIWKQGNCFHFDPTNHIHIFASNMPLDKAMQRRCRSFITGAYKRNEMEKIAELFLAREDVALTEDGMNALLDRVKPFPGDLEEVVGPIVNRAKAKDIRKLKGDDVTELLRSKGFFPKGLRREDITILNTIVKEKHVTADVLRFKVRDEKKKSTLDRVNWLASEGMVEPVRGGWQLAKGGADYMEMIATKQKAAKAARK